MSDDVLTGFVRLGVPLDFFGRDFTTWLARFKNRHPMVGLEVEANQSENLMKRSARGEFDLAFFKQQAGARNGTVALREQLVWVSGPNYSSDSTEFGAAHPVSGGLRLSSERHFGLAGSQAVVACQFCQSEFRMPEVGCGRGYGNHRVGPHACYAAASCGSSRIAIAAAACRGTGLFVRPAQQLACRQRTRQLFGRQSHQRGNHARGGVALLTAADSARTAD